MLFCSSFFLAKFGKRLSVKEVERIWEVKISEERGYSDYDN